MLIEAEFLALVLVLVYVGAVMVLFLFVVMMLDINRGACGAGFTRYAVARLDHGGRRHREIVLLWSPRGALASTSARRPAQAGLLQQYGVELGRVLYTQYAYAFELAALILLVAVVAAIRSPCASAAKGLKHAESTAR
jgi:NADH-quinone oxidoreductase subunit J